MKISFDSGYVEFNVRNDKIIIVVAAQVDKTMTVNSVEITKAEFDKLVEDVNVAVDK